MRKAIILSISFILILGTALIAQTGASCKPTSCGPKGTKTAEAAVITKLRSEVLALQKNIQEKELDVEMEMATEEELVRESEGESLLVIASHLWQLHAALSNTIPDEDRDVEFKELKFNLRNSGAQLVSDLNHNLKIMKKQVKALTL